MAEPESALSLSKVRHHKGATHSGDYLSRFLMSLLFDKLDRTQISRIVMNRILQRGFTILALISFITGCDKNEVVPPIITGFEPASGRIGSTVTITGSNFSANPSDIVVKFNGETAEVTSSSGTSITTKVPTKATRGKISVTVGGESVISVDDFTVKCRLLKERSGSWESTYVYQDDLVTSVSNVEIVGGPVVNLLTITYDSDRRMIGSTLTNSSGTYVRNYTLDSEGRIIAEKIGGTTTYVWAYNSSGQLISEISGSDVITFEYPNTTTNSYTTITYNYSGTILVNTATYDSKPNPFFEILRFPWVTDNNLTLKSGPTTSTSFNIQYNANGYPTSIVATGTFPSTVMYEYDCD